MPRKTLPSFTLAVSSRRDSFSLPDYYRQTRIENYGPYFRESVPDVMKTIDLRRPEDIEYDQSFVLPDVLEDEETEIIEIIDAKPMRSDAESTNYSCDNKNSDEHEVQPEMQLRRSCRLWRLFLSFLRKCQTYRVPSVKKMEADPQSDLTV